jgi:pyruvate kinase
MDAMLLGIIIDRGYLGVEIDITKIAIVQKEIIQKCQLNGKPVLLANQILESMKDLPRPSRSESSDVTSAVVDGADGLILSGETAIGHYPIESLYWIRKICYEAENHIDYMEVQHHIMKNVPKPVPVSESIACSAGNHPCSFDSCRVYFI